MGNFNDLFKIEKSGKAECTISLKDFTYPFFRCSHNTKLIVVDKNGKEDIYEKPFTAQQIAEHICKAIQFWTEIKEAKTDEDILAIVKKHKSK